VIVFERQQNKAAACDGGGVHGGVAGVYAAVIARVGCCGELVEEKSSDGGEVVMPVR
jgi:hypothetical protein